MDIATICGIIFGLTTIIGTILYESNDPAVFFNVPALAIVGGGCTCATMIHFSLPQLLGIFSIIKKTFVVKLPSQTLIIQKMVDFATINRRDGTLALEQEIRKLKDPFFARGLQMLVDGQNAEAIHEIMSMEVQYQQERHAMGKKILEFMGASSPSFAMVGTLIGLIAMLSKMSSPEEVGRGMAVALVCTFYGAFVANMLFIPLAGKLGQYSKAETIIKEMIIEGVCAIAKGENPTAVREKIHVFISANRRENVKVKS
jgi:chemotaxis protein MotA